MLFFNQAKSYDSGKDVNQGITDDEIIIGMSMALSGPVKRIGLSYRKGIQIYLNKVNKEGGVHGRRIEVKVYDDQYNPELTIQNVKKLIEQDRIFAMFGFVGTPTSEAALPITSLKKIPYIAPFTGADFLRNTEDEHTRYVLNVRTSYADETKALVDYFVQTKGYEKVGVFIQNDGYGLAGLEGVRNALFMLGKEPYMVASYERNSDNILSALKQIEEARPEVVIMIGSYQACALLTKGLRNEPFDVNVAGVSFMGSHAFLDMVGGDGENVIISQVVPNVHSDDMGLIHDYKELMRSSGFSDYDFVSLEGYVAAKILVEALERAGPNLTQALLMRAFSTINPYDLGGLTVRISNGDNQALDDVFLTRIENGKFVYVNE